MKQWLLKQCFAATLFWPSPCPEVWGRGRPPLYPALAHMRDIDIAILTDRHSVRDVPGLDEIDLTYCHSFFHHNEPNHGSFISIKHLYEILTRSPPAGTISTGVV